MPGSASLLSRARTCSDLAQILYHRLPDCGTNTGHVSGPASLKLSKGIATQLTGNKNEQVMRHKTRVTGDKLKPWCDNTIVSEAAAI